MNCTNCGAPVREGDKFCLSCGSPFAGQATPESAYPQPAPVAPVAAAYAPAYEKPMLLVIPVIFSLVGAIMLLVGDFGGWYNYGTYIEETVWINIGSVAIVLILPMAILLFYSAFVSVQALQKPVSRSLILRGSIAAMVVFIVTLLGGIILIAATSDLTNNWLDVGFYGGFFGGLVSATVLWYEYRRMGQAMQPMPAAAYRAPPPAYGQHPQPQPAQPPQPAPYQQPPQPQPPAQPQCRNCRALLQPGVKFCHICGAPQS
ncbi:MAG: zinc ribbon domain-containing protein [Candidatus Thermoplasmatota archaeon]|nr:zinc ribbon domain-containing protein [Candidatus Thermoplasmatota archaeon]